jgi:flagellar biosynthesis chaperone FliJ
MSRIANLDTYTPPPAFAGHGTVAVNGSADAATPACRVGPPRARGEPASNPVLSPARTALAEHLQHLLKLTGDLERVSKPVDRLRTQLSEATSDLQKAERNLATLDAEHSARIAEAARLDAGSVEPPGSTDAEAAIERSRRNCNSIRQALTECSNDQQRAHANLEGAKGGFDQMALRIFVEEHDERLEAWARARDLYYIAEVELLGLHEAIGQHARDLQDKVPGAGLPWFQRLEALRPPWTLAHGHVTERSPRAIMASASRWGAVLDRLKRGDASATF